MSRLFAGLLHLLHIARPGSGVQFVGFEDDNPIRRGADHPFCAQFANDASHDGAYGADGIGDFLLRHLGHKAASLLAGCGQIEQVAGHALAERAKDIASEYLKDIIEAAGRLLSKQPAHQGFGLPTQLQRADIE